MGNCPSDAIVWGMCYERKQAPMSKSELLGVVQEYSSNAQGTIVTNNMQVRSIYFKMERIQERGD